MEKWDESGKLLGNYSNFQELFYLNSYIIKNLYVQRYNNLKNFK